LFAWLALMIVVLGRFLYQRRGASRTPSE